MSLETAKATEQSECGGRRAVSATGCLHGPRRTREPLLRPSEIHVHRGRVAFFPLIERFPWGRKNYRMLLCAASSLLACRESRLERVSVNRCLGVCLSPHSCFVCAVPPRCTLQEAWGRAGKHTTRPPFPASQCIVSVHAG